MTPSLEPPAARSVFGNPRVMQAIAFVVASIILLSWALVLDDVLPMGQGVAREAYLANHFGQVLNEPFEMLNQHGIGAVVVSALAQPFGWLASFAGFEAEAGVSIVQAICGAIAIWAIVGLLCHSDPNPKHVGAFFASLIFCLSAAGVVLATGGAVLSLSVVFMVTAVGAIFQVGTDDPDTPPEILALGIKLALSCAALVGLLGATAVPPILVMASGIFVVGFLMRVNKSKRVFFFCASLLGLVVTLLLVLLTGWQPMRFQSDLLPIPFWMILAVFPAVLILPLPLIEFGAGNPTPLNWASFSLDGWLLAACLVLIIDPSGIGLIFAAALMLILVGNYCEDTEENGSISITSPSGIAGALISFVWPSICFLALFLSGYIGTGGYTIAIWAGLCLTQVVIFLLFFLSPSRFAILRWLCICLQSYALVGAAIWSLNAAHDQGKVAQMIEATEELWQYCIGDVAQQDGVAQPVMLSTSFPAGGLGHIEATARLFRPGDELIAIAEEDMVVIGTDREVSQKLSNVLPIGTLRAGPQQQIFEVIVANPSIRTIGRCKRN